MQGDDPALDALMASADWIQISSLEAIKSTPERQPFRIDRLATGQRQELPIATHSFDALTGYQVEIVGYEIPQPEEGPGVFCCEFDWPSRRFYLHVRMIAAAWPDGRMRAVVTWNPARGGVSEKVEPIANDYSAADRAKGEQALRAIRLFSEGRRARRGPRPYDREKERLDILQKVANRLGDHKPVSRGALAGDLALTTDGFDDKRERCGLTLSYLEGLTLAQVRALGIKPDTFPIRP